MTRGKGSHLYNSLVMARLMTNAEREEIAEIERRKKAEFEARLKALGPAFSAREPRLS